jgi:chorismate lyase/3-hydroxybenzoate synthase
MYANRGGHVPAVGHIDFLRCAWSPATPCVGSRAQQNVLGAIGFSTGAHAGEGDSGATAWLPVAMPALDASGRAAAACEVWSTGGAVRKGQRGFLHYREADRLLFGALQLVEADFIDYTDGKTPLQQAAEAAYQAVFALLDEAGLPHLLRVWNYFADINGSSHGLERYRQFNIGRQDAYLRSGRSVTGKVPAASALGTAAGPLTIYFIAARGTMPVVIENPRQVSAYHYPAGYGPRSPTFSRASVAWPGDKPVLFISGTASIVGHASMHVGDVLPQTRETLVNIEVLVQQAAQLAPEAGFTLEGLCCKVYLRDPRDLPAVRDELLRRLGPAAQLIFLHADICRAELSIEIEAVGGDPLDFSVWA